MNLTLTLKRLLDLKFQFFYFTCVLTGALLSVAAPENSFDFVAICIEKITTKCKKTTIKTMFSCISNFKLVLVKTGESNLSVNFQPYGAYPRLASFLVDSHLLIEIRKTKNN
jgi:hypothetical protein